MTDALIFPSTDTFPSTDDGPADGQRSRKRDSLFLAARLSVEGGRASDIRVRNLSEGGLMIDSAPPMDIGTPVAIEFRSVGAVPGKVAWYIEGRAGIAFDSPVDPASVRKPVGVRATPPR